MTQSKMVEASRARLERELKEVLIYLQTTGTCRQTVESLAELSDVGAAWQENGSLAITHVVIRPDGGVIVGIRGEKFLKDPMIWVDHRLPLAVLDQFSYAYSMAVIESGSDGEWVEDGWLLSFATNFAFALTRNKGGRVAVETSAREMVASAVQAAEPYRAIWKKLELSFDRIGREFNMLRQAS